MSRPATIRGALLDAQTASVKPTIAALFVLASAGCFSEGPTEAIDITEKLVVVQGVIRTDQAQQWLLVERTFNGTASGYTSGFIPGAEVAIPVRGATVTISNVSLPSDPCGPSVTLVESAGPTDRLQEGVYFAPVGCPTIRPGDTLELVVSAGDDLVTGHTIIPGTRSMTIEAAGVSASVPGPTLDFNRDTDTLRVTVDPIAGRSLIVEVGEHRFVESPDFLSTEHFQLWVDAAKMTLPGDLPDLSGDLDEDDPIPPIFKAGRYHRLSVAYADQNFYDQIRSENTEITGRGFISSVEGGIGFFGSMTAAATTLRVVGEVDEPLEGSYRMTGEVDGIAVSIDWEMYLNGTGESGNRELSAFADGTWVSGPYDAWTLGELSGDFMTAFIAEPTGGTTLEGQPELAVWELRGLLADSGTSTLTVRVNGVQVGTLETTKQ